MTGPRPGPAPPQVDDIDAERIRRGPDHVRVRHRPSGQPRRARRPRWRRPGRRAPQLAARRVRQGPQHPVLQRGGQQVHVRVKCSGFIGSNDARVFLAAPHYSLSDSLTRPSRSPTSRSAPSLSVPSRRTTRRGIRPGGRTAARRRHIRFEREATRRVIRDHTREPGVSDLARIRRRRWGADCFSVNYFCRSCCLI